MSHLDGIGGKWLGYVVSNPETLNATDLGCE
jgi:hypothetical protein